MSHTWKYSLSFWLHSDCSFKWSLTSYHWFPHDQLSASHTILCNTCLWNKQTNMQVIVMNPLRVFVLHSTLTKSMMGITVIAKLTKWFFSLWLCTSHPRVCLAPLACTALSGPLFILSLPSSHIHSSQWLTLPSVLSSQDIQLLSRDPACGNPPRVDHERTLPAKTYQLSPWPAFICVVVSFCYILF